MTAPNPCAAYQGVITLFVFFGVPLMIAAAAVLLPLLSPSGRAKWRYDREVARRTAWYLGLGFDGYDAKRLARDAMTQEAQTALNEMEALT